MTVLDDIKTQYPTLSWLVNDPEVGPLLRDAVDPNKGFSPETFQAKLYQTQWFKSRSTTQRSMEILKRTDPGEYNRQYQERVATLRTQAVKLGIQLTNPQLAYVATLQTNSGIDPNSEEAMYGLYRAARDMHSKNMQGGSVETASAAVRAMAKNEFYMPITDLQARQWGVDLAFGMRDEATIKRIMAEKAASLYPHLKEMLLNGGQSMEDIFSGHRAMIAEELELSPNQIDFTKDWSKVLYQVDPQTGQPRPMTLHETQTLAREDSRWWGTTKGRQQDAGMASFLLKTFGKRA